MYQGQEHDYDIVTVIRQIDNLPVDGIFRTDQLAMTWAPIQNTLSCIPQNFNIIRMLIWLVPPKGTSH